MNEIKENNQSLTGQTDKLPDLWAKTELGEIVFKVSVKVLPNEMPDSQFIGMDSIASNALAPHLFYSFREFKSSGNKFESEQVLYGRMRPYLNKVFKANFAGVCSGEFIVFGCRPCLTPDYLKYLLHHRHFVKFANSKTTGDRPRVTFEEITNYPVSLPPIAEQKRIVAKIEELFSRLDAGVESLKKAQAQLKTYRQAVLKWAFEGKLTSPEKCEDKIHNGWRILKLDDIAELCLGKMLDQKKNKGTLRPYLRNINVRWGKFDLESLEMMRFEDSESARYSVICGDLVVCEGGEPGRCAIWISKEPIYIQKALHRVRLAKNYSAKYVYWALYFLSMNGNINQYFTGTTIKHLTGRELKKIEIAFPPTLKEQLHIVSEIEERLSVCDKLEESIVKGLKQAEALKQSILKKAFEGKLVPQNLDDEPASILLERIRSEREKPATGAAKNATTTRKKKKPCTTQ